jgi:CRISPR-associated protein Cas1
MRNLHELPRFQDGTSYLYVERCKVEQDNLSITLFDGDGKTQVPCAGLAVLMLGPGTSITHAAIHVLAENGVLVLWCGEEGIRLYAQGTGKTRSAKNAMKQAMLSSYPETRQRVVERMYRMRFTEPVPSNLTIQQLRGMEGTRVRVAYAAAAKENGIAWNGRNYNRNDWNKSDPVNKALSAANACLYGICHAAIIVVGYSPSLGFIHVGKHLSFVYDIADLYKASTSIPVAFAIAKEGATGIEHRTRVAMREMIKQQRLLERIVADMDRVMDIAGMDIENPELLSGGQVDPDEDMALPGMLWDPDYGVVQGGKNFDDGGDDRS